MVRQCAWCLRLIDNEGKRISLLPVPKRYEATHGICEACCVLWLQQMTGAETARDSDEYMAVDIAHQGSLAAGKMLALAE